MKHENAVAGPSSSPLPSLFPPPFVKDRVHEPSSYTPPPQHLRTTDDLVTRFGLFDDYVKFVTRGFGTETPANESTENGSAEVSTPQPESSAETPGSPSKQLGPDLPKKETKKHSSKAISSYKALISQIPGKHSFKKDNFLLATMENPDSSKFGLLNQDFFGKIQLDGFNVSAEGLKGWNPSALVIESAQAKEDRKKRKELKKLARAHQQARAAQAQAQALAQTQTQTQAVPSPTTATFSPRPTAPSSAAGTPRPIAGTKRPRTDSNPTSARPSTPTTPVMMQAGGGRPMKKPKLERGSAVPSVA
ncbi:hypothetical protein DL96DRAFT_1468359 [Flagelloscypha sp. PMI_526]|nr:hypothetical protein DL96DRAFT_1468359 [Flagelloscypha sp. PMI_526]